MSNGDLSQGRPRARSRLKLRARLAISLFLLVGLSTGVAAAAVLVLVERAFEGLLAQRLEQLQADAERGIQVRGRDVRQRLAGLEGALRGYEKSLLERLLTGRELESLEVVDAAGRMMRLAGLDLLAILDAQGTVLSSGHWKEQVSNRDREVLKLRAEHPVLRQVVGPMGQFFAVVVSRPVRVGSLQVILFGGLTLDQDFLDEVAGPEAALLFDGDWIVQALGGRAAELDPASTAEKLAEVQGGVGARRSLGRLEGRSGSLWSARSIELKAWDERPLGQLVVAVDRAGLQALTQRLRWSFLLVGGIGALLAALAGVWIAGTVTRPVTELIRSVDAIAQGEADYTFPRHADHELDELVASFSRLHRSLAIQQQRALAAERVAAWREVARRVAHEIRNPLAPIRLTVENLLRARRHAPEMFDEMFAEGTRTILEEVEQLRRMVREFSEFARLPEPQPVPTDVEQLVDSVLALHGAEHGVEIRRSGGAGLPRVNLDAAQVSRALKNVVRNALEAMGGRGGTLSVETGVEDGMVFIEVSDDGPGLSPEALQRVFEPYFTTKNSGTGLGMAITFRIVTEHGGIITTRNHPEGGAVVTLRFPPRFTRAGGAPSVSGEVERRSGEDR